MADAANTPVDNNNPLGEFRDKLWEEYVKPLFDYPGYFRERARLLSSTEPIPDLGSSEWRRPGWKSPLSFALQGTLIVGIAIGLLSGFFSLFVKERPKTIFRVERTANGASIFPVSVPEGTEWSNRQKFLEQEVDSLKNEEKALANPNSGQKFYEPVPYSDADSPDLFMLEVALRTAPVTREQAEAAYHEEIATLEQQLLKARLSPYVEQANGKLEHVIPAISFLIAAYLFRILIRRRTEFDGERSDQAHIAYLYLVSARLFWVTLGWAVVFNLRTLLARYFPEQFEAMVSDLGHALDQIDHPHGYHPAYGQISYLAVCAILGICGLLLLWKASRQLGDYFSPSAASSSEQRARVRRIYARLIIANLAAGVATLIASGILTGGYGLIRIGIEHLQF